MLEPEAVGELVDHGPAERRGEIDHLHAERAGARIEAARLVARLRQATSEWRTMKLTLPATGAILLTSGRGARADEGQPALQLDIAREDVDEIDVGDAELRHQPEVAIVLLAGARGRC